MKCGICDNPEHGALDCTFYDQLFEEEMEVRLHRAFSIAKPAPIIEEIKP